MAAADAVEPPRIGLTTYRERAAWGVWDEPADLLPVSYATAVERAGGVALLLPPRSAEAEPWSAAVEAVLDGLHGLIIAGGADVDPERYGADRDPHTGAARPDRDGWEIALTRAAIRRGLPVLGICRGMQVLNVALGGDLVQHLPDETGTDVHCPTPGIHARHRVRMAAGGRLTGALGTDVDVATYHHQGLGRLGDGLVATGWAEDGTVEAVDLAGTTWVAGVQWHPEVDEGRRETAGDSPAPASVFGEFVAVCRAARLEAAR